MRGKKEIWCVHSKKNLLQKSTQFSNTQASTDIWNNKRDSTVEFDWQTYVPQRHGTLTPLGYLQSSSTEAIYLQPWTSCAEKFVFWKFLSHELQHRLRDSERKIRRYMLLKKFHHPFQFTIRIPPQHSIWPGCEPLKEVYTSIVGGFLFSYWIAFQQKCYCLFVYGALGTTQDSFISRRTLQALHCGCFI